MDMFKDKLTILDEADLIAIFGSIDEMKHQIECILLRQSFSTCTAPVPASENYTPLQFDEIF